VSGDGEQALAEVYMPRLGSAMRSGVVTRWLREEGEEVTEGEPLVEISTDKVETQLPAPASGRLQQILVQEEEEAEVGATIGWIDPDTA
jgi:2-oxoglutarate dehydrogenase E2 component (dihydrolipoamide succinyltransferase)